MGGLLIFFGEVVLRTAIFLGVLWLVWAAIGWLHSHTTKSGKLRVLLVSLGVVAGIGLSFARYMPTEDIVVFGLPFPVAILQRSQNGWTDYVGSPIAMLAIGILNVAALLVVTHGVAWVLLRYRRDPT